MPDITMCMASQGKELYCPLRFSCYRFKAKPSEYHQSYFVDAPFIIEPDGTSCEFFWKDDNENK